MTRPLIIGVMGGGSASRTDLQHAYRLGELVAGNGWILLNGGRNSGIMEASAKGAFEKGGLTIGILPDDDVRRAQLEKPLQLDVRRESPGRQVQRRLLPGCFPFFFSRQGSFLVLRRTP